MPKRIAAIPTDFLLREVASLDESVLLLPEQVMIFTGLTRGILKERMRTRPPQPPHLKNLMVMGTPFGLVQDTSPAGPRTMRALRLSFLSDTGGHVAAGW